MAEVIFFIAALVVIAGAVGTVLLRNAFYAVLALVCHLLGLAALFLLLRAEFAAAAQVIVYAGAVMVLYVFVVAYVGQDDHPLRRRRGRRLRGLSILFALVLLGEFAIAILGSSLTVLDNKGAGFFPAFGSPAEMGRLFLTKYLLAFELTSMLLLLAAVGAVVLARRRSGLDDPREISVADLMRTDDKGTLGGAERGTLQEAAGPPGR
jgi:NADH:ubiquinone oxidoreductase subunit 6 (subunit J)